MSSNTQLRTDFLAIHTAVATLPVPTDATGGVAVPPEWTNERASSIFLRFTKAAAAMSLAAVQVAIFMDDGNWYRTGPILNGGTAIVLTDAGYVVEVPVMLKSAKRISVVGTPTGAGTFTVAAAVVATQY
jgi:hypothetical protein